MHCPWFIWWANSLSKAHMCHVQWRGKYPPLYPAPDKEQKRFKGNLHFCFSFQIFTVIYLPEALLLWDLLFISKMYLNIYWRLLMVLHYSTVFLIILSAINLHINCFDIISFWKWLVSFLFLSVLTLLFVTY